MKRLVLGNEPRLADDVTSLGWAFHATTDLGLHDVVSQLLH